MKVQLNLDHERQRHKTDSVMFKNDLVSLIVPDPHWNVLLCVLTECLPIVRE